MQKRSSKVRVQRFELLRGKNASSRGVGCRPVKQLAKPAQMLQGNDGRRAEWRGEASDRGGGGVRVGQRPQREADSGTLLGGNLQEQNATDLPCPQLGEAFRTGCGLGGGVRREGSREGRRGREKKR